MDISQAYNQLRELILQERSDLTVLPKSVISDTFLIPAATEVTRLNTIIAFVSGLQSAESIKNILNDEDFLTLVSEALEIAEEDVIAIISGALDKLAANFNKTRKTTVTATGVINFYRPNPLTASEIASSILPTGTEIYTNDGLAYTTTADVAYSTTYFDPDLNVYMLDAPIIAQTPGTISNVPSYTITNLRSAVSGFGNVTNKLPISNGVDEETNDVFATRLQLQISGNNWGTPNGIQSKILQEFEQLSDVLVVSAGDAIMKRDNHWGGRSDVYLLEKNWQITTSTFAYNGEPLTYISGLRPISGNLSITSSEGSFIVYPDTVSQSSGSVRSKDYLVWLVKPVGPYPKNITLTYFYDKNVQDVQTFLEGDDYNTGADILARQATLINVDIFFQLVVFSGFDFATVSDNVRSTLTTYIDNLRLGESLEQSDVIARAYTVDGVDRIVLPMAKFNRSELSGSVDRIIAEKNEYIRINILNIS